VVVPDGPLENLPYAALRLPQTSAAEQSPAYLVQRYELVVEPSALSLLELAHARERAAGDRAQRVAVFADPVYSRTDPRLRTASGVIAKPESAKLTSEPLVLRQASESIALPPLPRLPGSRREAMDIQEIAGAQHTMLFLDFDASPTALERTNWSGYRVLHIAAHAVRNDAQAELSGIALSMVGPTGTAMNGVVRLHDVYRLHVPVALVVLSACGTSAGTEIAGEGVEGLARAFLVAGAQSVLATQWSADDSSAGELMQSFYGRYLRAGASSSEALQSAQNRMIEDRRYAAPYYWAGVVLEGNWRAQ